MITGTFPCPIIPPLTFECMHGFRVSTKCQQLSTAERDRGIAPQGFMVVVRIIIVHIRYQTRERLAIILKSFSAGLAG